MRLPFAPAALLFDMDGVLTDTAVVHAKAWKEAFDALLQERGEGPPFDTGRDYEQYVDGRSRLDGVRSFLASRDIELPDGAADDPPGAPTVHGIGRAKNDRVVALIRSDGVRAYPDAERFVRAAREQGIPCAVVSSSANARDALRSAGLADCFDAWVDGVRIDDEGLPGKPHPDTFLAAAKDLGAPIEHTIVFEDALAGVEAGHAGHFGCVVGVDRVGHADALRKHGADVVVTELIEIEVPA